MMKQIGCVAGFMLSLAVTSVSAQYPERPVTLIVPFAPGGGTDIVARYIADRLKDALRQPVVVENRPGAGGFVGLTQVARGQPDGYTLGVTASTMNAGPVLTTAWTLDPVKDFTYIANLVEAPLFIVTNSQTPLLNAAELLAYAKRNPGKLNFGNVAPLGELELGLIRSKGALDITIVPYKGSSATDTALLANEVQLTFNSYRGARAMVEAGKVRLLAVSGRERSALAPSIPSFTELGLPQFSGFSYGIVGPSGVPQPVAQQLNRAVNAVLTSPEAREYLVEKSSYRIIPGTPEQFRAEVEADVARFQEAARVTGTKPK